MKWKNHLLITILLCIYYGLFMPIYSISLSLITKYLEPEYLQMGSGICMFVGQGLVAAVGYGTGIMLNDLAKMACVKVLMITILCCVLNYFFALIVDCLGDKQSQESDEGRKDSRFRRKTTSVFFANPEDVRERRATSSITLPY